MSDTHGRTFQRLPALLRRRRMVELPKGSLEKFVLILVIFPLPNRQPSPPILGDTKERKKERKQEGNPPAIWREV